MTLLHAPPSSAQGYFSTPPQDVQRAAGGYAVNAAIPIPQNASPGTYVVETKVQAGNSYDVNQAVFVVR